jgi:ribonuclease P protein component
MLRRENRLTDEADFKAVFDQGKSFANRNLVLYIKVRSQDDPLRLGLSVSKKLGNAVVRNRIRRLLREAFRSIIKEYEINLAGSDYVIIARIPATELILEEMKQNILHLLVKTGKIPKVKPIQTSTSGRIK